MYKGFFVDDDSDSTYVELLSTEGEAGLTFELRKPESITELANTLFSSSPDIIALDYRLDENFAECPEGQYKAGPLAQQLRDLAADSKEKDFPIVLVSAEDKIKRYYKPDATTHDLFDKLYVKEDVANNYLQYRNELIGLIDGYRLIKSCWSQPGKLCHILKLSEEERYAIEFEELLVAAEEIQVPHVLARVLIHDLLTRPGILLSWNDVRAKLGVAHDSPDQDALKKHLDGVRFEGAFAHTWERWWRHRFDQTATKLFGKLPTGIPGGERVAKLNENFGLALKAAKSRWSDSSDELFAFSCVACEHPTELCHSVAAYDPRVPKFAERKRICWDCIRADRFERKGIRIANSDLSLADRIKSNTIG